MQTEITISVSPKAATEKESIKLCSARKLNIDVNSISDIKIHKRSIDARSRNIKIHLKLTVFTKGEVVIPKVAALPLSSASAIKFEVVNPRAASRDHGRRCAFKRPH